MNNITFPAQGRCRTVIEKISPEVDAGSFPVKRTVNETVEVEADIFADGHDSLSAVLKFRYGKETGWQESPMKFLNNDRWAGSFTPTQTGQYFFVVEAWVNHFESWRRDLRKKADAGQNLTVDFQVGAELIEATARRLAGFEAEQLRQWAGDLRGGESSTGGTMMERALDESLAALANRHADRSDATVCPEHSVEVDRERARFGAWYELFPRSCASAPGRHGSFKDVEAQLERIARLGFDILYLPPIHPIGVSFRKGRNNQTACEPDEPGSPWAIGSAEGGHKSVHPSLGTLEDFDRLVKRAREHKIEIALDIAFQCSPDHPYVQFHPEWFRHRPDGTIQHAENPPKVYQDIVPFDFECHNWRELWLELKSVFEFWIERGVEIFRVDNPHTKSMPFWGWCIGELRAANPNLIFLAEAFTRPKVMQELAKLGFTQSYNYFPWRNTKAEIAAYFEELNQPPLCEYFRPNNWPNTPDILPHFLQDGGPAAFALRFVLAATLSPSYGIYGPAFELGEHLPREAGAEEYLNSEKYEIKRWDLEPAHPMEQLIARVNQIRRAEPALQFSRRLRFHHVDNDQLIAYSKAAPDGGRTMLVIVNLNPRQTHSGWVTLPLADWDIRPDETFEVKDLLNEVSYQWRGPANFIELNPAKSPAHIFQLRRRARQPDGREAFI